MEAREIIEATESLKSHIDETNDEEISSADLADHLKTLKKHDEEKYVEYLEKLDPEDLANVALEMPDHMLEDVIETIPHEKIVEAIEELESDDQAELLQNIEDINEEKAKQIATDFLGVNRIVKIDSLGFIENGDIPVYEFSVSIKDGNPNNPANISISKKGGHIVLFNYNRDILAESLSFEQADDVGKNFLLSRGIENMKSTYYLKQRWCNYNKLCLYSK